MDNMNEVRNVNDIKDMRTNQHTLLRVLAGFALIPPAIVGLVLIIKTVVLSTVFVVAFYILATEGLTGVFDRAVIPAHQAAGLLGLEQHDRGNYHE